MSGLPVRCETCGFEWTATSAVHVEGSGSITMVGTQIGPCQRCGNWGRVRDGTYDFVGGTLAAFRALDQAALNDVRDVLREARANRITPDEAADQIVVRAPELERLIRTAQASQGAQAWVNLFLQVVVIVLAWMTLHAESTPTTADNAALERDVRAAIEQVPGGVPELPMIRDTIRAGSDPPAPKTKGRKKRPGKTHGKTKRRRR